MLADNLQDTARLDNWHAALALEKEKKYFTDLIAFIDNERLAGKTIYPPNKQIFAALQHCPLEKLRVVIIGQDPYHGPNQAHGLSFSVPDGVTAPPSLKNIFKEIKADLGLSEIEPAFTNLNRWADQGILLLNSVLTVEANKPASHANLGWETFTDKVIEEINKRKNNVVFLLWGNYAQKKGASIDPSRHLVLTAAHPSPFSAHNGFFGCKHFSKTNQYLKDHGLSEIRWVGNPKKV